MIMTTYPIAVPTHVTAVLRPDEVAYLDTDTGEWFGVRDGDYDDHRNVRALGITEPPSDLKHATDQLVDEALRVDLERLPLRRITRADANAFQAKLAAMNPDDLALLDEVRRFYERGGPAL
jgi:hypothetical protein